MNKVLILISVFALSACTALVVGGGSAGSSERPAAVVASDSAITAKVLGKFAADDIVSVFDIRVRTYSGTVTLTGKVGSIAARNRAETLAKETGGVKVVNNQIVIEDMSQ